MAGSRHDLARRVRIEDDVAGDRFVVAHQQRKVELDVGQPDPRNVATLPAAVVEQRVFELPVQVGDEHAGLWIHTKRHARDERFRAPIVVPIDRRPRIPRSPARVGNDDNRCGNM